MKLHHSPRGGRLMTGVLAILGIVSQAFADPEIPRGKLSVDSNLVRIGIPSQLSWEIHYPDHLDDFVEIQPPHTLKPKQDLKMRVRVVGSSFQQVKTNNGHGNNVDGVDASNPGAGRDVESDTAPTVDDEKNGTILLDGSLDFPVELMWSRNCSDWTRIFGGTRSSVVPTTVVLNTMVAKDDSVDFGARVYINGWLPLQTSSSASQNIVILKNGEPLPSAISAFRLGQIKGYLRPYLSSDGKTLKIGDRDMLILMELDTANPNDTNFNLQDLAVLVTFD